MSNSLKLLGAKELDAVLKQMAASTARRTTQRAMARALEAVAHTARALAPVGTDGYNDGYLKASIGISSKLTKRQAREARSFGLSRDVAIMYVGPSAPHAHLVEFGTGPRHKKNGQFVGAMPPDPFMRPAWDQNRDTVLDRLTDDLREEIDKTLARAAKRSAKASSRR